MASIVQRYFFDVVDGFPVVTGVTVILDSVRYILDHVEGHLCEEAEVSVKNT